VARLVADGLSNRQIATRLFVSERTAEYHVEQIRNKLGLHSRAQVAAWVSGQPASSASESAHMARHNLPVQLNSFAGRAFEQRELRKILSEARLVTLTGVGGVGKTRLALKLGSDLLARYESGVWLVDLAPVADPRLVITSVAHALGLIEQPNRTLRETVQAHLKSRRCLLLLDNCEHLVAACAELAEAVLRTCPRVNFLCTSREALRVQGEVVWSLHPLALPDDQNLNPLESESLVLFRERAQARQPGFTLGTAQTTVVAAICRRLDGIPLGIELAAALVGTLPLEQILERLDNRFRLLETGSRTMSIRQQTLRGTLEWSHDLLTEPEKTIFRRLTVFAGAFTLEAAEAICAGDGMEVEDVLGILVRLTEKSLLIGPAAGTRLTYRLLETVREFGRKHLDESGEEGRVRRQHLHFYLGLAAQTISDLPIWLTRLEDAQDDIRADLTWSLSADPALGLQLASTMSGYWFARDHMREGEEWLARFLGACPQRTVLRLRALHGAAMLGWRLGHIDLARSRLEEALAISRDVGDPILLLDVLGSLGFVAQSQSDFESARHFAEEQMRIAQRSDDRRHIAGALHTLGLIALNQGGYAAARPLFTDALEIFSVLESSYDMASLLAWLGLIAVELDEFDQARALLARSLHLRLELGDTFGVVFVLDVFAMLAAASGRPDRALLLNGAAETIRDSVGAASSPLHQARVSRWLNPVRQALGRNAAAYSRQGSEMGFDAAVAYALEDEARHD